MPSPPVILRQTLQQAKKSYQERGRPTLTWHEQRQLDRSIQLDRRAWGVKERERKRAEAVRKRQDKERRAREEARKVELGTQVRRDRFGYKSSQMHLGAFFGGGGGGGRKVEEKEEGFGDGGVDDESLLGALESPERGSEATAMPPPPPPPPPPPTIRTSSAKTRPETAPAAIIDDDDFSCFWDDLGSSTQIARELDTGGTGSTTGEKTCNTSFDSADFDITAEDLEDMSPRLTKAQSERALMPPPKLPVKPRAQPMSPPPPPPPPPVNRISQPKSSSRAPSIRLNPGFTMAELESFVDDDLQLTQAAPG